MDPTTFVGLDAHVATIQMAIIRPGQEPRNLGAFPNRPGEVLKRLRPLGDPATVAICYEAGPTGYGLYRLLAQAGYACLVAASSLIPRKPGERIKTDRRDAIKLARLLKHDELTGVAVPTPEQEAQRALSRAYEAAKRDRHRLRQRLLKLFQQRSLPGPGVTSWSKRWWQWADALVLPEPAAQVVVADLRTAIHQADDRVAHLKLALATAAASGPQTELVNALQCLHGIGPITSFGFIAEVGDLTRFPTAAHLCAYAGLVPSEHSSGGQTHRGHITKTGNSHIRSLVVEAAWHFVPQPNPPVRAPTTAIERIAAAARLRLYHRFHYLVSRGKTRQQAIVAIARELLVKVWTIAQIVAGHQEIAPTR